MSLHQMQYLTKAFGILAAANAGPNTNGSQFTTTVPTWYSKADSRMLNRGSAYCMIPLTLALSAHVIQDQQYALLSWCQTVHGHASLPRRIA